MIACHHPVVHKTHQHLWTLLVKNLGLDPKKILSGSEADEVIAILQRSFESGGDRVLSVEICANVLAAVRPDELVSVLLLNFFLLRHKPFVTWRFVTDHSSQTTHHWLLVTGLTSDNSSLALCH